MPVVSSMGGVGIGELGKGEERRGEERRGLKEDVPGQRERGNILIYP